MFIGQIGLMSQIPQFSKQTKFCRYCLLFFKKDYLSITKEETQYKALNTLGGMSFQTYVKHFKEETAWATKLANLNFPNVGKCSAADGNCPEYSGVISVNGADVTFTVTHGMDWENDIPPFKLNSSFSFKANGQAASWATQAEQVKQQIGIEECILGIQTHVKVTVFLMLLL